MAHFEIEIKSLLGAKEKAESLKKKFLQRFPDAQLKGKNSQLNHYFHGGDMDALFEQLKQYFSDEQQKSLQKILHEGKNHSIRTRQADGKVLFVVKASIDDTTSSNGIARMEFEEAMPMTLDELDELLLQSGLEYQAKWSRDREEYTAGDIALCLDRNAGYGYLAEFEKIVHEAEHADAAKQELIALMNELGVEELPQDRLERMFAHYNAHWPEYYGTENIFTIE
ncbi:MAG: CYTH domain-containing protein [Candidatus Moraniibacteriota bacterium]